MPPKRDGTELSGATKKRARMNEQRKIPVQPTSRVGGSAERGNNNLPPTIEVEKFAQTRSFEITAMQRAMKTAREAGTQRAFQSLPRHLRRRAASHNIKRLPIKLRAKALFETPKDAAKPKKKTRKMMGKKRRVSYKFTRTAMFLKRQWKKIWLETHIWHAKRMHMTEIWGHRLAEKPTEKAFRSSYRASFHGALLHDASYYQYIQITLPSTFRSDIIFNKILDPSTPSPFSTRYCSGTRECKINLYEVDSFPQKLIGPVTFIFKPEKRAEGYEVQKSSEILIRIHPSIATQVYDTLVKTIIPSSILPEGVKLVRFLKSLLTFEITGRRATEVIKAVLKPVSTTDEDTKNAWNKLSSIAGPSSVPEGMIFGLEVYDPRLSFPPKLDKSDPIINGSNLLQPSISIAKNDTFWSEEVLGKILKPTFKKKDIDARRSKLLIPGSKLVPIEQDNRIPILLSQNTIASSSSINKSNIDEMSGWTLTIPAGWGMAFWSSLVFSETRIGGLRERSQQFFEAGAARFPEDYPTTKAFKEYEERRQADDESYFDKRPPAKRPSYEKLGTKDPFLVNLDQILLRWGKPKTKISLPESLQFTNSTFTGTMLKPFLVPSTVAYLVDKHLHEESFIPGDTTSKLAQTLLYEWNSVPRLKQGTTIVTSANELRNALVRVHIHPCSRGSPEELGLIYHLGLQGAGGAGGADGKLYTQVLSSLQKLKIKKKKKLVLANDESEDDWVKFGSTPSTDAVIGRVTTGNYSLARGKGYAVGVMPLAAYLMLKEADRYLQNLTNTPVEYPLLALVRNRNGEVYRPVTITLMS